MAALQTNVMASQSKQRWFDLFRGDIFLKPAAHTVTLLPAAYSAERCYCGDKCEADGSHRGVTIKMNY